MDNILLYAKEGLMLPEPYNSILIIIICIISAFHFSGKLELSKSSVSLNYLKKNYPKAPKILIGLCIFVVVIKLIGLK